jgi:type II secretory pathway pseudopilin PulG
MTTTSHNSNAHAQPVRPRERGYTLVALLALMTILAIVAMSAAPSLRQQSLREREQEAIYRGEEVAEAIVLYTRIKGAPPTEMQQLLDGVDVGIKKMHILRPSAAIDPLSQKGEWKLVHPADKVVGEFQDRVMEYTNGVIPDTREPFFKQFARQITGLSDLKRDKDKDSDKGECGDDTESNASGGPFIGVVSRNRCPSVITYYGIERHDLWVFTPLFR